MPAILIRIEFQQKSKSPPGIDKNLLLTICM